jgi:protein-S-isoprenylcysteine O-methyltransferase Ste14
LIVWFTSSLLLNSIALWLSSLVLVGVYLLSAKEEEAGMVSGDQSSAYLAYRKKVGMLVPKSNFLFD